MSAPPAEPASSSHRQILRATSIIGSASVLNILTSVVKVKVLALLVGPAGVGLMGLFGRLMASASTLAGLGLGHSGVRMIAAASGEAATLARVRRALWWATLALGALGLLSLWVFREPLARDQLGDAALAPEVGWLGLGVFLSVVSASQTALLQGLRRIGDLARVSILGSVVGAAVGLATVAVLGADGVLWLVLAVPLASTLVAAYYAARLPRDDGAPPPSLAALVPVWRALATQGLAVMLSGFAATLAQLWTRGWIHDALGLDATGHFEAAWQISVTYIGFVLGAMSADYYPRLTAAIGDRAHANRIVSEQTETALVLAAPVLVGLASFAPLAVYALYSADFAPSIELLRLQAIGDTLKVASWPLGFILLARADNRLFLSLELAWNGLYLLVTWLLLPHLGLAATGVAFIGAYVAYFTTMLALSRRLTGYHQATGIARQLALVLGLTGLVTAASYVDGALAIALGVAATGLVTWLSLDRLARFLGTGRVASLLQRLGLGRRRGP